MGANPSLPNPKGDYPLHIASMKGDLELMEALLEKGADIDCIDSKGNSVLFLAVLLYKSKRF